MPFGTKRKTKPPLPTILKTQKTILDNLFSLKQKVFASYFLILFLFGSAYIFHQPLYLNDLVIGLTSLTGFIFFGGVIFAKKILFIENREIYQGLVFRDFIFYKKPIEIKIIKAINVYKNPNQQKVPWWTGQVIDLMISEHLYKLKVELTSGKEEYLISFKEQLYYDYAVAFLERNTNLKIQAAD